LGRPKDDPQVAATANKVIADGMPSVDKFDFYRWYYSALGLFQTGVRGEHWIKWNEPMKKALLTTQVRAGTVKEHKGSWNYDGDHFGSKWGRVGQTALGALMLEVYYRYHSSSNKRK